MRGESSASSSCRVSNHHKPPGSMPAAVMTTAAAGEVRNLNNALTASGSLALVISPAEIMQQLLEANPVIGCWIILPHG